MMVLTISSAGHSITNWVLDSGATSCATFDESDCTDVRACQVQVTAAGSCFTVERMGTATVRALDEKGRTQIITLANCLISPQFPYKLLSVPRLTKKGHVVTMEDEKVRISNKLNDIVLVGVRDPTSQLFLLQEAPLPLKPCSPNHMVEERPTLSCCGNCTFGMATATLWTWRGNMVFLFRR
jgi:hypothetical protein